MNSRSAKNARPRRQHTARRAEAGRRGPDLREARGTEPDGLDQGPHREGDDRRRRGVRRARARPRAPRADERQHGNLARARREAQGLSADVRDARERDGGAQATAAALRRGHRLLAGRRGLERRRPAGARARRADAALLHAVPVRERGEPARALRRNRSGDRRGTRPRRRRRRRPRHRRNADGNRRASARNVPRHRRRRGGAAAGRSCDGAALARRRLRPADPRRLEARPQGARHERGVGARGSSPARRGRHLRRRLGRRRRTRRAEARRRARRRRRRRILADGGWKYLSADFWEADDVEQAMERTVWW